MTSEDALEHAARYLDEQADRANEALSALRGVKVHECREAEILRDAAVEIRTLAIEGAQ